MSATAIGLIVFALVFGSALLAMYVHSALPEHHVSVDSKDTVKLGVALIATMAALVLGLLVASAKSAYDTRSNQLVQVSADIILLDRALARYGPETKEARALLQRSVAGTVERFWPAEGAKPIAIDPNTSPVEVLYEKIETLSPQNEAQHAMQTQAQLLAANVGRTRLLLFENLGSSIPVPFLVVLVFWLCIIFASFGLFAPRNATVIAVLKRLCAVGSGCDLSDPRARPVVRGVASGFRRSAARGVGAAGPVELDHDNDLAEIQQPAGIGRVTGRLGNTAKARWYDELHISSLSSRRTGCRDAARCDCGGAEQTGWAGGDECFCARDRRAGRPAHQGDERLYRVGQ